MKELLQIEWLKIRRYNAFWILMGLFVLAAIGINAIMFNIQGKVTTQTAGNIRMNIFDNPYLWQTTGWLIGFTLLLPGFLIIILVCNEYSYKTFRQQIINGSERTQVIFSKWLLLLGLAITCWLVYFFITLYIGASNSSSGTIFIDFQFAGYTFLKILLALSVALILSLWIKRSGLAIAIYLIYYLLIESIIGHFLDKIWFSLGNFLPLATGSTLVPNPFERYLITSPTGQPVEDWYILAAIGWIILFILLSVRYIRSADL